MNKHTTLLNFLDSGLLEPSVRLTNVIRANSETLGSMEVRALLAMSFTQREQLKRYPNLGKTTLRELFSSLQLLKVPAEADGSEDDARDLVQSNSKPKVPHLSIKSLAELGYIFISRRLMHCIRSNDVFSKLTLQEILTLEEEAASFLLRHVPNFGKKSLKELLSVCEKLSRTEGFESQDSGNEISVGDALKRFVTKPPVSSGLEKIIRNKRSRLSEISIFNIQLYSAAEKKILHKRLGRAFNRHADEFYSWINDVVVEANSLADDLRNQNMNVNESDAPSKPRFFSDSSVSFFLREFPAFMERHSELRDLELGTIDDLSQGYIDNVIYKMDNGLYLKSVMEALIEFSDPTRPFDLREEVSHIFSSISERERRILCKRNGILGEQRNTLEAVGFEFGVTRERIRQIEKKAVRKLTHLSRASRLDAMIFKEWLTLREDFVSRRLVISEDFEFSSEMEFCISLVYKEKQEFLALVLNSFEGKWTAVDVEIDTLKGAVKFLEERIALDIKLPIAIGEVSDATGLDDQLIGMVGDALSKPMKIIDGYIIIGSLTSKKRRAIGILNALDSNLDGVMFDIWDLCVAMRSVPASKDEHPRNVAIALYEMNRYFVNLKLLGWVDLRKLEASDLPYRERFKKFGGFKNNKRNRKLDWRILGGHEENGLHVRVHKFLDEFGPQNQSSASRDFHRLYPIYSQVSFAVVCTTSAYILRLAPSIVGLREHANDDGLKRTARDLLKNLDQVRLFVNAKRAGRPFVAYPLWDSEMEFIWCAWLKDQNYGSDLENLLMVSDIDNWPVQDPLKKYWGEIKNDCIPKELLVTKPDIYERFVTEDDLFTGLLIFAIEGYSHWMHVNQGLGWRIESQRVVLVLYFLVEAGLIEPIGNWDGRHEMTTLGWSECRRFVSRRLKGEPIAIAAELERRVSTEHWTSMYDWSDLNDNLHQDGRIPEHDRETILDDLLTERLLVEKLESDLWN